MHALVVGAGTFGASLAWRLARAGEQVTLVDQFEPGDRRANHTSPHSISRSAPDSASSSRHSVRARRAEAV